MRLLTRLEYEQNLCAIQYVIFRQSPESRIIDGRGPSRESAVTQDSRPIYWLLDCWAGAAGAAGATGA